MLDSATNRCLRTRRSPWPDGTRSVSIRSWPVEQVNSPTHRSWTSSDDGLTEDEIAARFAEWLADLESVTPVELHVNAADELHRAYADDDV